MDAYSENPQLGILEKAGKLSPKGQGVILHRKRKPRNHQHIFLWVKTEVTRPLLVFAFVFFFKLIKFHKKEAMPTVHDSWLLLVKMASDTVVRETR